MVLNIGFANCTQGGRREGSKVVGATKLYTFVYDKIKWALLIVGQWTRYSTQSLPRKSRLYMH